jgi:putative transposase
VSSRRIVGWRAHTTMRTDLVLDAREQALHGREMDGGLVVHSGRGSQYVAMRYTEQLAEVGAAPSVGSTGDAYNKALAESVIGLCKTEVIRHGSPWRGFDDVEYATLKRTAWFNQQRLFAPLGYVPPAGVQRAILPRPGGSDRAGRAQLTEPPQNPGRFTSRCRCTSRPDPYDLSCERR